MFFKIPVIGEARDQVRGHDDRVLPRLHLHVQEGCWASTIRRRR